MDAENKSVTELPSFQERLLMAVLAPIFFNLSILIVLAVFLRRSLRLGAYLFYHPHWPGALIFLIAVALPALAGFTMGVKRFATLLGHFFYTNMEHEKDVKITLASWVGFLLIAYLLSGG